MVEQSDYPVTIGDKESFITTVIQDGQKLSMWMAILTPKGLKQFRIDELGFDLDTLSLKQKYVGDFKEKAIAKYISHNYKSFDFFCKQPKDLPF